MFASRNIRTVTVILIFLAISPSIALGAGLPSQIVSCKGTDCTICDIAKTAQNVLNTGIFIAVFLSAVLFAWAGSKYIIAGADSGAVGEARNIFTSVGIGLAIILAAWLIVDTIMRALLNQGSAFGPWNKICELLAQHFLA